MADINEQWRKLVAKARALGGRLFAVGLGVLLAVRAIVFLAESAGGSTTEITPSRVTLKPEIDEKSPNYTKVKDMIEPWPEFKESAYWALASNNMFDPRRVLDASEIEKRAREKYTQALVSFRGGDLQKALTLVEESLDLNAKYQRARDLRKQIKEQLGQNGAQAGDRTTTASAAAQ